MRGTGGVTGSPSAPPAPPTFTETPPQYVEAKEGSSVTLTCMAFGNPKPIVTWLREGELLAASSKYQVGAWRGNSLAQLHGGGGGTPRTPPHVSLKSGTGWVTTWWWQLRRVCSQPCFLSSSPCFLAVGEGFSGGGAAGGSAGPSPGFWVGATPWERGGCGGEKGDGLGMGGFPRPRTRFPSQRLPLLSQAAIPPEP